MRSAVGKWLDAVAEELSSLADSAVSADSVQKRPNGTNCTNCTNCKEPDLAVRQPIPKSKSPPEAFNVEDWHAYYDERAAIAERDGGLDRTEAEHQAFNCTVVHWLNTHPEPNPDPDVCGYCRQPLTETDLLPVLNGPGNHVWLHPRCLEPFNRKHRAKAIAELEAMGLRKV
jgi:hypothetical protein